MDVEAFPIRFTRGIRSHWRRRKYQRLDGAGGKVRSTQQLGARRGGGAAGLGVRLSRLLRVRVVRAPACVLRRMQDAYVGAMHAVASRIAATKKQRQLPAPQPSEFEKKLILEIYKSIVASKELTAMLHSSDAHLHTPSS